ncbi:hypothetical protein AVEN_245724-1 [Araneus ventricosus]|uniref:Uncharacterized protein n=1 Tax=Araneus ventricosus TaxID=182803 RepID=A0A4Y2QW63_ARAVE|nr:hypothetical protein AVEN_245724-1 [Araneus ventricosus]
MLNWWNETFQFQREGRRDEDAEWAVEVWLVLNSLNAGGRGCSVTEAFIYENDGQYCGNGAIALDSTEKTIEGKKNNYLGSGRKRRVNL